MYLGKMNCKGFLSHRIHKHSTKNKPHISLKWHSMVWTFDQGLYFKMNNHHRHLENSVLTCSWTICGCVPWQLLDKNQKSAQKDCCYTVPLDSSALIHARKWYKHAWRWIQRWSITLLSCSANDENDVNKNNWIQWWYDDDDDDDYDDYDDSESIKHFHAHFTLSC